MQECLRFKEEEFYKISISERAIFLPHCLCSQECKAKRNENGVRCINCGKCGIGPFKEEAEQKGYKVFIVPGASMVKKIMKKNNFKAILSVACMPELEQGLKLVKDKGITSIAVPLLKDGCVNTEVDWDEVRKKL